MIKIKRGNKPDELSKTDDVFRNAIEGMNKKAAYKFFQENANKYKYNTKETKKKFKKMNYEKCSFCTKHILDFDDEMTVEHIRTKKEYPQEIFNWDNLLCSCRTCNTKRSIKKYDENKYLDPTREDLDIEKYFTFNLDGTIVPNEKLDLEERKKADYMIKLYCLNREGLICARRNFFKKLVEDDEFFECLNKEDKSSQNIIFLSIFTYYYRRCKK